MSPIKSSGEMCTLSERNPARDARSGSIAGIRVQNTDSEIISAVLDGDTDAFAQLADRYKSRVNSVIYHLVGGMGDTEDLTQETFLRAWSNLHNFQLGRKFSSWLLTIARNLAIDHLKKKRLKTLSVDREDEDGFQPLGEIADNRLNPEEGAQREFVWSSVSRALDRLPESYRTPLVLRHMDDLSYEEIAEVLGQPLGSIKSKIHRGRRMLQERLTAEGLREYIGG